MPRRWKRVTTCTRFTSEPDGAPTPTDRRRYFYLWASSSKTRYVSPVPDLTDGMPSNLMCWNALMRELGRVLWT